MIRTVFDYIVNHAVILSALAALVMTGVKSYLRRPKKTSQGGVFLTDSELLEPPLSRPAYSDRMAYVLAEMSALAYFKFENSADGALQEAVERFRELKGDDNSQFDEKVFKVLEEFRDNLLINTVNSKEILDKLLKSVDFQLLDTINVGTTQGFACKRVKAGEPPYVVIAFRGTEKEFDDWLTDTNAVPASGLGNDIKVHKGFWEALNYKVDGKSKSVLEQIVEFRESSAAREGDQELPCYFTGHSLGGALALLTARELAQDSNGVCYSYGAPRVANYEYFKAMKIPVFRVVNSADIVPRVPPGAFMGALLKIVQGGCWLTQLIPGCAKSLKWLELKIDKLNGYRHHGDQRYLTDVKSGKFKDVRLLTNPPMIDRIWWMWQHIRKSLKEPVRSHGMAIYRHKLLHIAKTRNP